MAPVFVFLLAMTADLLTTQYGLRAGCAEINPVGYSGEMIRMKIAITGLVGIVLIRQRARLGWLVWLPGGIMYLVVVWNIINILAG